MYPIIEDMQRTVSSGEQFQIMMPRGFGKTSFVKGVTAWALAFGVCRFVEVVGANAVKARAMLRDIWRLFCRSPKIAEDFPEIAEPLALLEGKFQRAPSVRVGGKPTDIRMSADEMRLPTVEGFPSSGALLIAVGFKAASRGAVFGETRPDLIIFDDIQDSDMAHNEERVDEAMDLITADFLGGGSHLAPVSAFMTATPIAAGDLTDRIRESGAWKTSVYKMMSSLPACLGTEGDLWEEYALLRRREKAAGGKVARVCKAFYQAHRVEMDRGAEVLNPKNYVRGQELSAIQHAMNLRIDRGEAVFDAEYQMEPHKRATFLEISARLILQRVRQGTEMRFEPPGMVLTVAATDINPSYALSTAIVRFDVQRTAFVCAYFVTRCKISDAANDTDYHRQIFTLLAQHGRAIGGFGVKLDAWGVDAGGKQFEPVTRFATQSVQLTGGLLAIPMLGRAGRNWNPNVRSRIRNALNDTVWCRDQQGRVWMAWNADLYKESAQRAWATETGAPGGCSLFDGGVNHVEFATQIANETLKGKLQMLDGRIDYSWRTREPHDFGDCMAMAYALAGSRNVTGQGVTDIPQPERATPSAEVDGIVIGCDF
jgi:hypothetical protein